MVGTPLRSNFLDTDYTTETTLRPLWTVPDFEVEKDVQDWCNNAVNYCEKYYSSYFQLQFQNLLIYQGQHWQTQDKYNNRFLDNVGLTVARRTPRLVFNHCYDFVEHHVSRATRYRPSVAIYPANREQQDADNAKVSKDVLDYVWYINNIDLYLQQWVRYAKIFGESFLKVDFDPNKGDVHPDWIKAKSQGIRVPLTDSSGQQILGQDGKLLFIEKCMRVGELKYEVKAPWHYFEMPCNNRDDIEWCIEWDCVDPDYLRAKYPDKADDIKADAGLNMFNDARFDYGRLGSQCIRYKLYHDSTEFLDGGRYIVFTKDCILENTKLPFSHGKRPFIKIHDLDVPDCIRGMSFYQQIFPINHQINACGSLIYKMLVLLSHPKIAMPDGACEMNQLVNENTVLTYQGGVPPTLLHMNPPIGEPMRYMEMLTGIMEKLSGNFEMSRGQAPSGVRAAKALRVLDEQEDKRSFGFITKYNQLGMVENAKMTLSVAGDFYDDSDGRLARIVGKDNEYRIRQFKSSNLSKPYDIRIENTTALSQSPSARFDEINEMMQVRFDPNAPISRAQYYNLLDLGASEQFKDIATKAVKCAQSENDDILSGMQIKDPTVEEDLIEHWKVHLQACQGRDYKEITPDDRKEMLKKHTTLTEYLMFEKAFGITDPMGAQLSMGNPMFAQRIQMECPNYPVYFSLPVPPTPPMGMMPPGAPSPMPSQPTPAIPPGAPLNNNPPIQNGANVVPPGLNLPPMQ
jgi:hypothetical protein